MEILNGLAFACWVMSEIAWSCDGQALFLWPALLNRHFSSTVNVFYMSKQNKAVYNSKEHKIYSGSAKNRAYIHFIAFHYSLSLQLLSIQGSYIHNSFTIFQQSFQVK